MMYVVYILYSQKTGRYYVGQTQNIEKRLERHNSGRNKSTKAGIPWKIVHVEYFEDRPSAVRKETPIKNRGTEDTWSGLKTSRL
jgi:putative endonuclease